MAVVISICQKQKQKPKNKTKNHKWKPGKTRRGNARTQDGGNSPSPGRCLHRLSRSVPFAKAGPDSHPTHGKLRCQLCCLRTRVRDVFLQLRAISYLCLEPSPTLHFDDLACTLSWRAARGRRVLLGVRGDQTRRTSPFIPSPPTP